MKKLTLSQRLTIAQDETRKTRRELETANNQIADLRSLLERTQGDLNKFVRLTARTHPQMPRDVFEITMRVERHDLDAMASPEDYAQHLGNVMLQEIGRILRNPPR